MSRKSYLLSLPERIARSVLGLGAGAAREVGQVVLPGEVRKSRLYKNVVDGMLRFVIEKVGGAQGVYGADEALPDDFVARRTAGNVVEVLGIVTFRASPVWILAALADVVGMGRHLIPEIAGALKEQGLLEADAEFASVDQILDGLERTSARLAATVNTPPLRVAELRKEWAGIQEDARKMRPTRLPTRETLAGLWSELKSESVRQKKSIFETSSLLALSAARSLPGGVRWLSASTRVGALRAGQVFAGVMLDHYRESLRELRQTGYVSYARQQLAPYVQAAAAQFSPQRGTLTERLLDRMGGGDRGAGATPAAPKRGRGPARGRARRSPSGRATLTRKGKPGRRKKGDR